MKILVLGLTLLISPQGFTQHIAENEIYDSIDEMVKSNIISEGEGKKAKLKFKTSEKKFLQTTNRMPASIGNQLIDSYQGQDLSKVQMKQIEKEIDVFYKKVLDK